VNALAEPHAIQAADERLVDDKLLGRLLDEHAPALVLYARTWCDTPQDVVQDAFVQLVRQPQTPQCALAWLYQVVRNRAISVSRSAQRRRKHEGRSAAEAATWFAPAEDRRLDAQAAAEALAALPLEQRETVVAKLWGGLSFDQIAVLTQTSSSTAHRRYQAALSVLRERLGVTVPERD
jgi:RNA polymerase sigma-70 factor (ECF subfamily)